MRAPWVVVGAGSAGCVAAARMSEDPDRQVVLLEAGPPLGAGAVPPEIDGPNFLAAMALPDRGYPTLTAQRVSAGVASPYRRGRGVGGSSAVNAMVALRGSDAQYRSWGWDDTDVAWQQMALPEEVAAPDELGSVDHALLAANPDARRVPLTRVGGRRVTSAEAYLWPATRRSNLTVRSDTVVDRILWDGRTVAGVLLADGERVDAGRVVLAAGAIHTPAILLRSGADTPGIGTRLQDHPSVPLTLDLRAGVAQDPAGLVIGAICERAGVQFLPMNHLGAEAPGLGLLLVALMRPHGRAGSVRLRDHDAASDPVVDFALLSDERDVTALLTGVEHARQLLSAPAFADIVEHVYIDAHGTTVDALDDPVGASSWLRSAVGDYVHASSSCAMGTVLDVDGSLRGYEGLFVCDASAFPSIPDVNTHLPTTMLAERLCARWRARDRMRR